jgi:hypothetical protein
MYIGRRLLQENHFADLLHFAFRPNSNIAAFSRNKTSVFRNYTGTLLQYIEFDGYLQSQQVSTDSEIDGKILKNGQEQRGKVDGAPSRSLTSS